MRTLRRLLLATAAAPGAFGQQRILAPAGPAGQSLTNLGWFVLLLSLAVAIIMWGVVILLLTRPRGSFDEHAPADEGGGQGWILYGGFLFPVFILAAMYAANVDTMRQFPLNKGMNTPAQIRVIGHQWWWEVHYLYGSLDQHFVTADEIHIPTGTPVDIDLNSVDVIHSFWVPALHGKVDLIPGNNNRIRVEASHPGTLRGQCAEYCGDEHAKMILLVVAQKPDDFERWLSDMRKPAAQPVADEQIAGQKVFMNAACPLCHTLGGTLAQGTVGPNLTHIGSRKMIASNWLENNFANLQAWILHARSLKPGVVMPNMTEFNGDQSRQLTVYLQSLK